MGSFDRMWTQWIQFDRTIWPNTAQQGEEHVVSHFSQPPAQSEENQHLKLGLCSCPPELQIQDHVVGPLVFSTWLGRGSSKTIAEEQIKSFETLIVCLRKPKLARKHTITCQMGASGNHAMEVTFWGHDPHAYERGKAAVVISLTLGHFPVFISSVSN